MTGLEFFLYGLLKAALTGAVAGMVIAILILSWGDICSWFQARTALKESDIDNIGFSLHDRMVNGNYKTVHGIFNTRTGRVLDARNVASQRIDCELAQVHRDNSLVVIRS